MFYSCYDCVRGNAATQYSFLYYSELEGESPSRTPNLILFDAKFPRQIFNFGNPVFTCSN